MESEPAVGRVVLDTNAVSALFEPRPTKGGEPALSADQLEDLRANLVEHHGRGAFRLVINELLLRELASMPKRLAQPRIRFVCELADGRVLRRWDDIVVDELRSGDRLADAQAFDEYEIEELIGHLCSRQDEFREAQRESVEAFREHDNAGKGELQARGGTWRCQPFGGDATALLQSCEQWAGEALLERARALGIPTEELPPPRQIPSLWAYYSYMTPRLRLTYSGQRRFDGGDAIDGFHYASSVYATAFVTCDKGLLRVCEIAPAAGFDVVHFDAWAQGWPGS
jgi:hypothetical protein